MRWTPTEIKRRRQAKNWSQDELAEQLGVSRRAVTTWETGAGSPRGANIDALERVLGDAPVPEITLRGATNLELVLELARRLGQTTPVVVDPGLLAEDHAWPRQDVTSRTTRRDAT